MSDLSIGGSNPAVSAAFQKFKSNAMLDVLQQTLSQAGVQESPDTLKALQGLRDAINGNQTSAAQQLPPSPDASPSQGADSSQQGGQGGVLQELMQLLKIMEMLMQMQMQMQQNGGMDGGMDGGNSGGFPSQFNNSFAPSADGDDQSETEDDPMSFQ